MNVEELVSNFERAVNAQLTGLAASLMTQFRAEIAQAINKANASKKPAGGASEDTNIQPK